MLQMRKPNLPLDPSDILELRIAYSKPYKVLIGDEKFKMRVTTVDMKISMVSQPKLEKWKEVSTR